MRTTIDLPDELHQRVSVIAKSSGLTLSETISRMVRGFLPAATEGVTTDPTSGLVVFTGGQTVTSEDVRVQLAEDEDAELGA